MPHDTARALDVRKTYKLYIGGQFVRTESGRSYPAADGQVNAPRGSRKDLREAVRSARGAFPSWTHRTAYNRGQIIYRCAEMLDSRRREFSSLLGDTPAARREVRQAVDTFVWYAGWCDKLAAVVGTVNPVAGPYFTFTVPEPTGVVAVIAPEQPALLGLVRRIAPALAGGNCVVATTSEQAPLPALVLGEVLATSDIPEGVVNLVSGLRRELLPWLASHMDVNAIDVSGASEDEVSAARLAAADNVKRVVEGDLSQSLEAMVATLELKTIWHPVGR